MSEKETADYLAHLTKVTSDSRRVRVVERRGNGVYVVETIDTKAKRLAHSRSHYAVNEWIDIQSPSASGNVHGAMDTITTPAAERRMSETTPSTRSETITRSAVFSVDPEPLVLEIGGAAGEQVIVGMGLASAGTYVPRGMGDDPLIENADDPIITTAKVTRSIRALDGSPAGYFDLLLDGSRVKRALRIRYRELGETLFVLAYSGFLHAVDPRTLAVVGSWDLDGAFGGIAHVGTKVIVTAADGLRILDTEDNTLTSIAVAWPDDVQPYYIAIYGGKLWFSATGSLTRVASVSLGGVVTLHEVAGATSSAKPIAYITDGFFWLGDANNRILKFDAASGVGTFIAMPEPTSFVCAHGGSLYVSQAGEGGTIYRRNVLTGAAISSNDLPYPPSTTTPTIIGLVSAGGKLFAVSFKPQSFFTTEAAALRVWHLADDLSSATEVWSTTATSTIGQIVAARDAVLIPDGDFGTVHRIDAKDFTHTVEEIDSAGLETAMVYAPVA